MDTRTAACLATNIACWGGSMQQHVSAGANATMTIFVHSFAETLSWGFLSIRANTLSGWTEPI